MLNFNILMINKFELLISYYTYRYIQLVFIILKDALTLQCDNSKNKRFGLRERRDATRHDARYSTTQSCVIYVNSIKLRTSRMYVNSVL